MIKEILENWAAPVAVSLTLALSTAVVDNSKEIAIISNQDKTSIEIQKELVREVKQLVVAITRVETKLEIEYEHTNKK